MAEKQVPRLSVPLDEELRTALLRAVSERTIIEGRPVSMGEVARQILREALVGKANKAAVQD